jgi:hypothetical protein
MKKETKFKVGDFIRVLEDAVSGGAWSREMATEMTTEPLYGVIVKIEETTEVAQGEAPFYHYVILQNGAHDIWYYESDMEKVAEAKQ